MNQISFSPFLQCNFIHPFQPSSAIFKFSPNNFVNSNKLSFLSSHFSSRPNKEKYKKFYPSTFPSFQPNTYDEKYKSFIFFQHFLFSHSKTPKHHKVQNFLVSLYILILTNVFLNLLDFQCELFIFNCWVGIG